jgi:hypothetical protein
MSLEQRASPGYIVLMAQKRMTHRFLLPPLAKLSVVEPSTIGWAVARAWRERWYLLGCVIAILLFLPTGGLDHMADFYPIYFGAQRVLEGQSPYGVDATAALAVVWPAPFGEAGIAYPLPMLMLAAPLTLLPYPAAAFLWTAFGLLLSYACVLLVRSSGWPLLMRLAAPFAFWPFYNSISLDQASLLSFGLAVLLVLAIQRQHAALVAVAIVLLLLKPQNGAIFALYGLYWIARNHRGQLMLVGLLGGVLLASSLLWQPDWIGAWLAQVKLYGEVVAPSYLLPLGAIVLLAFWRLRTTWWAKLAIVQTLIFPITSLYSLLPLLMAWCAFTPPLALLGASVSWLMVLLPIPASLAAVWLYYLVPLLVVLLWEGRPRVVKIP